MSELIDPSKPAGAVVEELPDGTFRTNDGRILQPAAKNPWYVLMTIYGEQTETYPAIPDYELHSKNQRIWNGWMCQGMPADERAKLAKLVQLPPDDLAELTEKESGALRAAFEERLPLTELPHCRDVANLSETHFPNMFTFEKCIFRENANFRSSSFSGPVNFRVAIFNEIVSFLNSTFIQSTEFSSAKFKGDARFQSSTFSGPAHFDGATFSGPTFFNFTTFSRYAFFKSATFIGKVDFSDGAFKSATLFNDVKFETDVPKFFQREMHQNTTFTTNTANWPKVTAKNAEEGKQAYTRLRQVMSDLHKPDDEHFFSGMKCVARPCWTLGRTIG